MPFVTRPCGARIRYSVRGTGATPVLLLAPGGMRSCIANWKGQPYDAWTRLSSPGVHDGKGFKVIAMDQRSSAGLSDHIPLATGWDTFRDDQLAVLDDAAIDDRRCLLVGSCIGPSFIINLLRAAPQRFSSAVLMQPIGLGKHTTEPGQPWQGLNTFAAQHWFGDWAQEQMAAGRAKRSALADLYAAMFVHTPPFVFTASRDEIREISHPLLVLAGQDCFHPTSVARELAFAAPNAELIERWRDEHHTPEIDRRIEAFLSGHSEAAAD